MGFLKDPSPAAKERRAPRLSNRRSGQSMIEFALSFLLFLAIVMGFAQLALAVWMKSTLHHAAREGVRYGVTGSTESGMGHVQSIKQKIKQQSAGLVTDALLTSSVRVRFFDQDGNERAAGSTPAPNTGGNTLLVEIIRIPVPVLMSPLLTWVPGGLSASAGEAGRLEPYPVPPTL